MYNYQALGEISCSTRVPRDCITAPIGHVGVAGFVVFGFFLNFVLFCVSPPPHPKKKKFDKKKKIQMEGKNPNNARLVLFSEDSIFDVYLTLEFVFSRRAHGGGRSVQGFSRTRM